MLEQVRDRIFSNIYMLNATFLFGVVLKLPEPEDVAKTARHAFADYTVALVDLYERGADESGERSQGSLPISSSSDGRRDSKNADAGAS